MANHVPRLGRRSLSPFNSKQRNGFRFFGGVGDGGASGEPARNRNLAGFFGPLFNRYENFRYYGGRPSTETKASKPEASDQDYWQNVIGEATINSVLEKMAEIGETREIIEDFNNYNAYGVGNPLPKYLARWNHPVATPKVKVPQTSTNLNKYKGYYPKSIAFPRRKKGRTFTRIFSRRR